MRPDEADEVAVLDEDPDDEELDVTDPMVVTLLGFDPLELDESDEE